MTSLLRSTRTRTALLVALLLITLVAASWRLGHGPGGPHTPRKPDAWAERSVADATLELPREWRPLARERAHATWGDADRSHTVTLAALDVEEAALATIVRDLAASVEQLAPGARLVGAPEAHDVERGGRGDSAMVLRLEVPATVDDATPTQVVQVWRRDTRAGRDVVATYTSSDGTWPVDPTERLPASRLR